MISFLDDIILVKIFNWPYIHVSWLTTNILLVLAWISSNFDDEGGEIMYFEYRDI